MRVCKREYLKTRWETQKTVENGHCCLRLSVSSLLRPVRVYHHRVCVADEHLGIKLFAVWSPNDAHVPDNNHKQPNNNSTVALWASPHGPQSLTRLRNSTLITGGRKVGGHCKTLLWIIHLLEFPTRTLNRLREQVRLVVLRFSDVLPTPLTPTPHDCRPYWPDVSSTRSSTVCSFWWTHSLLHLK